MAHDNLTAAWRALQARAAETRAVTLRALRDGDPARGSRFAREAVGLYLDFSRQRIDDDGLRLLASLADAAGLRARIEAMWRGEAINTTEGRAVLHTALRVPGGVRRRPGRRGHRAPGARRARAHAGVRRQRARRRGPRFGRRALHDRHQHRHRRLGPGSRHGGRRRCIR